MPQPPVVTIKISSPGYLPNPSYFDVHFLNSALFGTGHYDSWCADAQIGISLSSDGAGGYATPWLSASVYSTYETPLLANDIPTIQNLFNMDVVNWLLSQNYTTNGYTTGEVQGAIWGLLGDPYATNPTLYPRDLAKITTLMNNALAHDGYVPDITDADPNNDKIALVLFPHTDTGVAQQPQLIQIQSAALGDYVWEDMNADGEQDAGENGVAGVTVNLWRDFNDNSTLDANEILATTTTDATGYYKFVGLAPGFQYQVQFVQPSGFDAFTLANNAADTLDSDADANGITAAVTLAPGEYNTTLDAGLVRNAHIGDTIWEDLDADGQQDAGEPGIANVTVQLKDQNGNVIATDTTDANGIYGFDVPPGTYSVTILPPAGYVITPTNQGNDVSDSDIDGTGNTGQYTLVSGETNLTVDGGLYRSAEIGDKVWLDADQDGQQDAGEAGVANVTVHLKNGNGNIVATQQTNGSGEYLFTGLMPGNYSVQFVAPAGYAFTQQDQGADVSDSDADVNTGATVLTNLQSGESDITWDAGLVEVIIPPTHLGDLVWEDKDADGQQDAGEQGIANVTVQLKDSNGNVIATTTTDANGLYGFDVAPGTYSVAVVAPAGYVITPANQGNDVSDSDIDGTGNTGQYTLASGDNNPTIDAGLYRLAEIGDKVWLDADHDGQQDAGEAGVANVTVHLKDGNGNIVATQQTNGSGEYLFTGLAPGNYSVQFVAPAGYAFTFQDQGADASDSDANAVNGNTIQTTLDSGESDLSWDAGLVQEASLGDRLWVDANGNGQQDDGATGIVGASITLIGGGADGVINGVGDTTQTATTGADGYYQFTGLNIGEEYQVQFTAPAGMVFTGQNIGSDLTDSDVDVTTGKTQVITLGSGEHNPTLDAGVYAPVSIGDKVWEDQDADGQQDGNEPGIDGVTVRLYNCVTNELIATTTTAGGGLYHFGDLPPGTYHVVFDTPAGYVQTTANVGGDATDSDAENGVTGCYTLPSGASNTTVDAGYWRPASLGDYVWLDSNNDGQQNDGNTGMNGVTVNLYTAAGAFVATTVTANNGGQPGYYLFNNLMPGDYKVEFVKPAGYAFAQQDQGADGSDSDANQTTGMTVSTTLVSGENDLSWDAGLVQLASLGDRLWVDTNGNGQQDDGATGIAGATVTLIGGGADGVINGVGDTTATTTTGADGYYQFTGLNIGEEYQVQFTAPTGFNFTLVNQGADSTDSDVHPLTGKTHVITLNSGEHNPTLDAGVVQVLDEYPASIGNFVWLDSDADGLQDAGEQGVAGVTVKLLNSLGAEIDSTTTDANGYYLFDTLDPDDYAVQVVVPAGYFVSNRDVGSDDSIDSDIDPLTGQAVVTTLSSDEHDMTWDAGLYQKASIGDRVWLDANGNGQQDLGEAGVANVTVHLKDAGGAIIATQQTNALGDYLFSGLMPGGYSVQFELPNGYAFTGRDLGADASDSDADVVTGDTIQTVLTSGESDLSWDAGLVALVPGIAIDKEVVGVRNPDGSADSDGLVDQAGDQIDYRVSVSNTGQIALTGIELNDSLIPNMSGPTGDLDNDNQLDVGETWVYTGTYQVTAAMLASPELSHFTAVLPETATITVAHPGGPDSYFNTTVSNGGALNGTYNGWCVDLDHTITPGQSYTANVYSSYDTLPAGLVDKPQNLDLANWVINQGFIGTTAYDLLGPDAGGNGLGESLGTITYSDIQRAIWTLVDNTVSTSGLSTWSQDRVDEIVSAAMASGENFAPDCGDQVAVILQPVNANGDTTAQVTIAQVTFAEVGAPCGDCILNVATVDSNETGPVSDSTCTDIALPASIGDRVWLDANANGVQDAGEQGIAGVTVNLLNAAGAVIGSTSTNASGDYLFSNLNPGDYGIEVVAPAGYVITGQDLGGDDAKDSDINAATGRTVTTTLSSGENDLTWDAGLYQLAAIGDKVWYDVDKDGIQDAGEAGVAGVRANLLDANGAIIATQLTNASGEYLFSNLNPGDYRVDFDLSTLPAGYTVTTRDAVGSTDANDSDANPLNGQTSYTSLSSGETDRTWDMGIQANVGIDIEKYVRGRYFEETGGGEGLTPGFWKTHSEYGPAPLSGWPETGFDPDDSYESVFGVSVPGTPTLLDALNAGGGGLNALLRHSAAALLNAANPYVDYQYSEAQVISMTQSAISSGNYEATKDLFVVQNELGADLTTPAGGGTEVVTAWEDADSPTGPYIPVGGTAEFKYEIRNTGDVALGNILVSDDRIASLTYVGGDTDNDGLLDVNETWTYSASETVGAGVNYVNTGSVSGTAPGSGQTVTDSDLAHYTTTTLTSSLGDKVWLDANANGVQDAGEAGVAGVTVHLLNGAGAVLATQATDADGYYLFDNLTVGNYAVQVVAPAGYAFTGQNLGGDDDRDSDVSQATGISATTSIAAGEVDLSWDAGLVLNNASIGDRVWLDCDGDGLQDANEAGMGGVTVRLLNASGTVLDTTTTDYLGNYLFDNLAPGNYAIQVVAPAGYGITARDQGSNDAIDSDIDATGKTVVTTLVGGENDLTWDAGLTTSGVCVDLNLTNNTSSGSGAGNILTINQNGLMAHASAFSRADSGGAWSTAYLATYSGGLGVTSTGEDGSSPSHAMDNVGGRKEYMLFEFDQVVSLDQLYMGWVSGDSDVQIWIGNANNPYQNHLNLSDALLSGMFTEVNTTTLTTARWADVNAGDYMGNVIIVAADTTDTSPEDYFKLQTLSVCTPACGLTSSIGDRVWHDANANGIQDAGEAGVAGVVVELRSNVAGGAGGTVLATTTTDANGYYLFDDLTPGDYHIDIQEWTLPADYVFSAPNQGGDDNLDSDVVDTASIPLTWGVMDNTTLEGGENDLSWDVGIYKKASLGDRVWCDTDRDGIQDAGEAGVAGVTVKLLSGAGAVLSTTTTDASGNYLFSGLNPGDYAVQVVAPSGYGFTGQNQGSDDALDSDVNASTGISATTTLVSGENDLSWDAGIATTMASVSGRAWCDTSWDGIRGGGELGVSGVQVKLLNSGGTTLATTTTNSSGEYTFANLAAGTYQVQFTKPTAYQAYTLQNKGTDDTLDSDVNSSGRISAFTVAAGQTVVGADAGFAPNVTTSTFNLSGADSSSGSWGNVRSFTMNGVTVTARAFSLSGTSTWETAYVSQYSGGLGVTNRDSGESGSPQHAIDNNGTRKDYIVFQFSQNVVVDKAYLGWISTDSDMSIRIGSSASTITSMSNTLLNSMSLSENNAGSTSLRWADFNANNVEGNVLIVSARTGETNDYFKLQQLTVHAKNTSVVTPIAIDLDGDGIQTVALGDAQGSFDLLGNGSPIASGWLGSGDGFLAVDRNGNGRIDDITELFGGQARGEAFAQLADYDSNGDGQVNAADADFASLLVWCDANGNHQSDAGELMSLAEAGVASLGLAITGQSFLDAAGNLHLERASATLADGTVTDLTDVYFGISSADAAAAGMELPNLADLLSDSASLDGLLGGSDAGASTCASNDAVICDAGLDAMRQLADLMDQAVYA